MPDIIRSSFIILFLTTLRPVAGNQISQVFVHMLTSTSFYAVHILNLANFKYTCFFIIAITIFAICILNIMDNLICTDRRGPVSSGSVRGPVGSCYEHNDSSSPTTVGYFLDLPIANHFVWTQLHGVNH